MRKQWIAVLLAAGTGAAMVGIIPAAASQPQQGPTVAHGIHQVSTHFSGADVAHVIIPGPTATSATWSGYVDLAVFGHHFTSISSSFTIPSVNCAKVAAQSFVEEWVGLDGWGDNTNEHVGVAGLCVGGGSAASYLAFYQMSPLPGVFFDGVSAGDAVTASVAFNAGKWTLTLTDITAGTTILTTTQTCPAGSTCRNASAEVITEDPHNDVAVLPMADFGQANYVDTVVTGQFGPRGTLATNPGQWISTAVRMVRGGHTLAVPSTLEGGQAFQVAWQASQ